MHHLHIHWRMSMVLGLNNHYTHDHVTVTWSWVVNHKTELQEAFAHTDAVTYEEDRRCLQRPKNQEGQALAWMAQACRIMWQSAADGLRVYQVLVFAVYTSICPCSVSKSPLRSSFSKVTLFGCVSLCSCKQTGKTKTNLSIFAWKHCRVNATWATLYSIIMWQMIRTMNLHNNQQHVIVINCYVCASLYNMYMYILHVLHIYVCVNVIPFLWEIHHECTMQHSIIPKQ